MLNGIEAFERLAYFGVRSVVALYIMQATEPGGLHLTAMHKGVIYAWWAIFQSFLPIVTGGIADRYGYKRVLVFAITMNAAGYVMMANFHDYVGFFAGILVLATGTAFFKPALQGSIAQNLTKKNSSVGWGIFYWVVNVGAVAAPIIATAILGRPHSADGWQMLFYACAAFTLCNLLLLFTFTDVPSGASKTESPWQVLVRTIVNIFEPRLLVWLAIMSCFWLMMYQLWDLHPNFITDWVDSSGVAPYLYPGWHEYSDRGQIGVQQQILLNTNAALIVLLMVPLSWAVRKMRTLTAMLVGMCVATVGVVVAGLTSSGWMLLLGIVFFSLGEMWTGPKKNEYLGLIAPPGKKALYLGYVNIPVGIGLFVGSYMAGYLYGNYGEKATLALKELGSRTELVGRAAKAADWSDALEIAPDLLGVERARAFETAMVEMGRDKSAAAAHLEESFRYDSGHLTNLALPYLALQPDYRKKAVKGLAQSFAESEDSGWKALEETVEELGESLAEHEDAELKGIEEAIAGLAESFTEREEKEGDARDDADEGLVRSLEGIVQRLGDLFTERGDAELEALEEIVTGVAESLAELEETRELRVLGERLSDGHVQLEEIELARFVDLLPEAIGVKRPQAFEMVRHITNEDLPEEEKQEDEALIAMLHERFAGDPATLDNLALEYLAQATDRMAEAVSAMEFPDPVKDLDSELGIGRTKSFAALAVAMGAGDAEVDAALLELGEAPAGADLRPAAYLVARPHHRFNAVARRDWSRDVAFLRELIESDEGAMTAVARRVDEDGVEALLKQDPPPDDLLSRIRAFVSQERWKKLSEKQGLIQKALDAKGWRRVPEQAARLLAMNPYEARALVSVDVGDSAKVATKLLWEKYDPQYRVWLPFAGIGLVAIIALAIFGQMAKRWKDMDA